jgi:diguanylate cyclase (GGDEF)-like protein/PAS domain S-box-containing protein
VTLRVALVGLGATQARDLLAALADAGFYGRAFSRMHRLAESKRAWNGVIFLSDGEPYTEDQFAILRELSQRTPLIIASPRIDMDLVRSAASLGAHDVVLRGDNGRVIESLRRAIAERTSLAAAHISQDVRDELMRRLFDLTPNYVSIRDAAGRFVMVSQAYADLYGTTVDEMLEKPVAAFIHNPVEAQQDLAEDAEVLRTRRSQFSTHEMLDSAGTQRLLQIVKRPIVLDDGRAFVMCVSVDITRGQRAETTLEKTNEFLKNVLETISDAVFALDLNGKFTLANQRLSQMTGYKHHELIGMPFTRIFASESLAEVQRMLHTAVSDTVKERRFEAHVAHADSHQRIVTCSLLPLKRGERTIGIVGTAIDITDRKAAERRIEHLAYHDPLTGLPNRRLLNDRLTMALSQAERDGRMVAVLFVDLDRFKSINDSLGHRTGDLVLQELGGRLRACMRSADTVARMGGDEFVFLLPALHEMEEAIVVARRILDSVRKPFQIEGREFVLTASAGISFFPLHGRDADTLIKHADTALFENKRRTSDSYEIFDESMSARSLDYFTLENDLRRGITHNELALVYQPIVEMRTERVVALEALVRWNHPGKGLLPPDDFIGLAEETGLIVPLGDWVLREACRQNREWQRHGLFTVPVSVNISVRQLDSDLLASVSEALDASSLPAQYLDIELTESVLMQSAASSSMVVDGLKELGTRISVDDFGTGYSSLSYLERFPIDALKIDRSFMPHDPEAPGAGIIAGTIISMAQSLGIDVIAEGVETRAQRDFLLARGCSRAQGHYYWSALTPQEVETLIGGDARDGILA